MRTTRARLIRAAVAIPLVVAACDSTTTGPAAAACDDQLGTVASMELNPAKARVLLQLALLKTKNAKTIQGYFDRY